MSRLYELVSSPDVESPVLVMGLKGWIDAGMAADAATDVISEELQSTTIARFDADALLDWRARRPLMQLEDGVNQSVTWEETVLDWAQDSAGNDLLILSGNEPDHAWLAFTDQVVDLALQLGARMIVGLGAYPAAVPHTRPVLVASSASSPDLAAGFVRNTVEVPSGVQGLIERRAAERGLPVLGLWAQVPHYVAAMPYPAASLELLRSASRVGGVQLPEGDLAERAEASRARIEELIGQNHEHRAMLEQLEQQADDHATTSRMAATSGDELAAELERFLKEQG